MKRHLKSSASRSISESLLLQAHPLGDDMAPYAVRPRPELEGHLVVAPPAPLALEYLVHGDGVGARLGQEYLRMTVVATQPVGMYGVGEDDVTHDGHLRLYEYVEVEGDLLSRVRVERAPRVYEALDHGRRPVDLTVLVLGEAVDRLY